ncbi:MAG TPA: hypothetical protein VFT55_06000 [Planctomycetota bacterium]|nr:hypothetical protein [Planctomycetota bacterium]
MEQSPATRRACWIGALLPVCFAIWLHGPMWDAGLLSDDLLLRAYVVDPGPHGPVVAWRRVLEDLQGPWLFGPPFFYRPLATFTFVLEYWLSGGAEWMPHVTNIALFAACVFGVGRLAAGFGGPWAAFTAGMLFAAHPVGNEMICWPCARADLLIVAATVAALAALARQRRTGGLLPHPALVAAAIAALLSKESALLLAPLLVAFDLMLGGGDSWRRRAVLHLVLMPVWLLYLWWRTHLGVMPAFADLKPDLDWSLWPSLQVARLSRLVAPGVTATSAVTVGLFTAFVAVTAARTRGVRRWIAFASAWVALTFAPTSWQPLFPNLHNSRFVLLASLGLALAAGVVAAAATPRWWAWVGRTALVVMAVDMAAGVRTLQDDYARQWQLMRTLREQIAATAPRVRTETPLVLLSVHLGHDFRLPFLDAERAYPLATPPLVPAPLPFVSLGSVLDPAAGPALMQGNVAVWRVMWQHGATLAFWRLGEHSGGELVTIDRHGVSTPRFSSDADGFVPDAGPASPWSIGGLEVTAGAAFAGGRVVWQAGTGHAGGFPLGPSHASGTEHRQTVDVSADPAFVIFGTLGGIVRMAVELDGPASPRATALTALPMPELEPLRRTLRGAPMALAGCGTNLAWDSMPADAEPGSAAVVLMNRSFGFRLPRPTRGSELSRDIRLRLWQLARFGGDAATWYYLECRVAGRTWRSEVDWFVDR